MQAPIGENLFGVAGKVVALTWVDPSQVHVCTRLYSNLSVSSLNSIHMIVLAFTDSSGRPNRQEFFQSLDLKITTSDADYRTRYKTHSARALWRSHCKISTYFSASSKHTINAVSVLIVLTLPSPLHV